MVFYRNTYNNTRGGNIFNDVPALCLYLSSPLYIFHKRPASSTQIFLRRSSKRFGIKYFDFLEKLRQSGETNMYGAVPYLQSEFPELRGSQKKANAILIAWIKSFEMKEGDEPC